MNPAAYTRVLGMAHAVRLMARQVAQDDALTEAIAAIDVAYAAGHVVDPTLYQDRRAAMLEDHATLHMVRMLSRLCSDEEVAFETVAAGERDRPPASGEMP